MPEHDQGAPESAATPTGERAGPRALLPIPVVAKIGRSPSRESRLRDVSVSGLRLDWTEGAEPGEPAIVRFEGYPGVCSAFILTGRVVRAIAGKDPGLGIVIDRKGTSAEVLESFRRLVLHYMRHRPLLAEIARDFFEGRCEACDWLGRVGTRAPVCPRCGEQVRRLDPGQ